jgi:hypothetical protein
LVEYFPAGQSSQVDAPAVEENFPAGHRIHVAIDDAFSVGEYVPAVHDVQDVAPSAAYVPAAQDSHFEAPFTEYVPATQV